jgi:CRP/FNR family transcriptional regulator, cyclic AMP receptor protein
MTLTQRLLALMRLRPPQAEAAIWHLSNTHWSEALGDGDMEHIGAACPPRPDRKGEQIYRLGEPAGTLYVLEGHVKLSRPGHLGAERVLNVCGPDDVFGKSFLTSSATTLSDAIYLTEQAIVCPVTRAQFLEIVRLKPGVAVLLSSLLASLLREL